MDPSAATGAQVEVLVVGSLTSTGGKVMSTCSLIVDGDHRVVVDPGFADSRQQILDALGEHGLAADDITDVVLSHHHPDHTLHAGLFGRAAVHDHWAIYRGTKWEDSDAEGRQISVSIQLIRVPGHTLEDIATVVRTADGTVVLTHLWFNSDGPIEDPTAEDGAQLHASRERVLAIADLIVPGHGAPFRPTPTTPR